jgi:hypothetical protein
MIFLQVTAGVTTRIFLQVFLLRYYSSHSSIFKFKLLNFLTIIVTARRAGPGSSRAGPSNRDGSGQRSPDLKAIECSAVYIPGRRAGRGAEQRQRDNKRFKFVSIWGPRLPNSRAHFPSMQIRHLF